MNPPRKNRIVFANALPPLLGAMLLQGWDAARLPKPFADRPALTREAIGHRHDHTLLPETGIADVARVLRRHVDAAAFERALDGLPPGARDFWAV